MSEKQPADVEEDVPPQAKSAEDRKAASALASLDNRREDDDANASGMMDQNAVNEAMQSLRSGGGGEESGAGGGGAGGKEVKLPVRNVKVDAADVALLVDELDLTKPKATELLKANDGDAVKALRAWVHKRAPKPNRDTIPYPC